MAMAALNTGKQDLIVQSTCWLVQQSVHVYKVHADCYSAIGSTFNLSQSPSPVINYMVQPWLPARHHQQCKSMVRGHCCNDSKE